MKEDLTDLSACICVSIITGSVSFILKELMSIAKHIDKTFFHSRLHPIAMIELRSNKANNPVKDAPSFHLARPRDEVIASCAWSHLVAARGRNAKKTWCICHQTGREELFDLSLFEEVFRDVECENEGGGGPDADMDAMKGGRREEIVKYSGKCFSPFSLLHSKGFGLCSVTSPHVAVKDPKEALLGGGAFGKTYSVLSITNSNLNGSDENCEFACKIIDVSRLAESMQVSAEHVRKEMRILKTLRHPNIIRFIDAFWTDTNESVYHTSSSFLCIILELCDSGTLLKRIGGVRGGNQLLPIEVLDIILQTASALQYLHDEMTIVHRDVKLDNIFLASGGKKSDEIVVKLGDFGLATSTDYDLDTSDLATLREQRGHICYRSPENLLGVQISFGDDIFALGLCAIELLTGQTVVHRVRRVAKFQDKFSPGSLYPIVRNKMLLNCLFDEVKERCGEKSKLFHCICGCLIIDAEKRLSASNVKDLLEGIKEY
eukprot:g3218.t1